MPWFGNELAQYLRELMTDTDRIKDVLQSSAKPVSAGLVAVGGTIGTGLLHLVLAIFIAYFFFRHGTNVAVRLRNLSEKFGGERGNHLLEITKKTLIGVVYGIIGTALAQGALAAFGFWIAGVPAASLLGLLTCFLSFIPIGPPLIWGPAAYWLFTQGETGWAIFMLVWGVAVVSAIDNVLKPYFISLGSNLPFVLVLFGIGGGVLGFGFIGIFIGPTLLALAYSLILELSSQRPVAVRSDEPKIFE
jgi:predicted PurR-regulated permease PerM